MGEALLIDSVAPPGAEMLELGCGVGRVTGGLVALGHAVTAVDESPEMLAHVTGAETVLAEIRSLDLGRRFPVVVMASHLVNTAEDDERAALLAACARHVAPGGAVLLEAHAPDWEPAESTTERDGIRFGLHDVRREGDIVSARVSYRAGRHAWTHAFRVRLLDDRELRRELAAAGLVPRRRLGPGGDWIEAGPADVRPSGGG
jgi:SAM-dependent methyltransferase